MIVRAMNLFNTQNVIKAVNQDNRVWLFKQAFIVILTVLMMCVPNLLEKYFSLHNKNIFSVLAYIIAVLNFLVFEIFYSSYYILIPYIFLCLMNAAYFIIVAFVYSCILNFIPKVLIYFIGLLFTLIHMVYLLFIGNGSPKIICSVPSELYLVPMECDLSKAKDGVYYYFIGRGDLFLVNKINNIGMFMKLTIENKKIRLCELFENGKRANQISIKGTDSSYKVGDNIYYKTKIHPFKGFDENGKLIFPVGGVKDGVSLGRSIFIFIFILIIVIIAFVLLL